MLRTQHGSYSLLWQGNILIASYSGLWNEIAAKNLHRDAKILWLERGNAPWCLMSDGSAWEGGTQEALDAWWAFFEDGVVHGMVAVSDILPTSFHEKIVKALADKAGEISNYHHAQSYEEALTWLAQQLPASAD